MEDERHRLIGYWSRVVAGLIACAVVAVTFRAHVAALAILVAVSFVLLAITPAAMRDGHH